MKSNSSRSIPVWSHSPRRMFPVLLHPCLRLTQAFTALAAAAIVSFPRISTPGQPQFPRQVKMQAATHCLHYLQHMLTRDRCCVPSSPAPPSLVQRAFKPAINRQTCQLTAFFSARLLPTSQRTLIFCSRRSVFLIKCSAAAASEIICCSVAQLGCKEGSEG
jgi:hypothetical protein